MMEISFVDIYRAKKALGEFGNKAPEVIQKTLDAVNKEVRKQLPGVAKAEYDLDPDSEKAPDMAVQKKPEKKKGKYTFRSAIKVKSGSIGLDHFRHYYGRDVNVAVKKGPLQVVKDAFAPHSGKFVNHKGLIFKRETKYRKPIKRLFSIPVAVMYRNDDVQEEYDRILKETYDQTLPKMIAKAIAAGKRAAKRAAQGGGK
jgi:hypothetical protein